MRIIFFFTILIITMGCTKENRNLASKPHIISEKKRILDSVYNNPSPLEAPPPPPRVFSYGTDNFIIDSKNNLYYYKRELKMFCAAGIETDTIPYFINLKPIDLIRIPEKSIHDFVMLNLTEERHFSNIASQKDTLNSQVFSELINSLDKNYRRNKKNLYIIRETTQEEDSVLHYKKNNKFYSSDNIKWNKTKIKLSK